MPFRKRPFSFCHFLSAYMLHRKLQVLCQFNFHLHAGRDGIAEHPHLVAPFENCTPHSEPKLPPCGIVLVQYLRIEQMGRKKSVPLVHDESARFLGKLCVPFNVPRVGGRYIDELHSSSVSVISVPPARWFGWYSPRLVPCTQRS